MNKMSRLHKFILSGTFRFAFAGLLSLIVFAVHPAVDVQAKKKATYGTIKILTTPGRLLLTIDGKPRGETLTVYRAFDLEPGIHNIEVKLPNGQLWTREIEVPAGRVKCVVVNYRPLPPLPKSPCPFPVSISAPDEVNEGDIITYSADVAYSGTTALNYTWKVTPSSARIISGMGSPTLNVDTTGLGGQRVTATLVADDGSSDPTCAQTAQAVSVVKALEKRILVAQEFDECNNCTFDDQKARLDNLAVELQNEPSNRAYIIAYGGRTSPLNQVERLMTRARDYLVAQRGIDGSRLVVVNGGFREEDTVELWVVPSGAAPPRATPTVKAGDLKPPTRRRRN
jgi:hypothetical protein